MKADKSKKLVILCKEDYFVKIEALVNDRNSYRPLRNNTMTDIKERKVTYENNWENFKFINDRQSKFITRDPRFDSLVKTHKNDWSLRPIVDSIDSCYYKLTKILLHSK